MGGILTEGEGAERGSKSRKQEAERKPAGKQWHNEMAGMLGVDRSGRRQD